MNEMRELDPQPLRLGELPAWTFDALPAVGAPAPAFALPDAAFKVWTLDDFANRPVLLGGRYINREMAEEGMAWYYRDYAVGEYDLDEAESNARRGRRGLWKDPAPQPPWEWRREHKKE